MADDTGVEILSSKSFFRISELAGARWPSATVQNIFEWHDANLRVSVFESGIVDAKAGHQWGDPIHAGRVNLLQFWVCKPGLLYVAPVDDAEGLYEEISNPLLKRADDVLREFHKSKGHFFFSRIDENYYFIVPTQDVFGLQHRRDESIQSLCLYTSTGHIRLCGRVDKSTQEAFLSEVEIFRDDLLIKRESVLALEQAVPEIKTGEWPRNNQHVSLHSSHILAGLSTTSQPAEQPLRGMKEIAAWLKMPERTAKLWKKKHPSYFNKEGRSVFAYPSKLNALIEKKGKS